MTYNMESFLKSSVDIYLSLSRSRGFQANLRTAAAPFIGEDHSGSPQGAPCGHGQTLYCPHCRHAFPQSESVPDSLYRATMRKLMEAVANPTSSAPGVTDCGVMGPVAAKILMKVLYAARMARPDLQRAICHLACFVTKWDASCDRRLHRLMCYISSTYHLRLVGWVGDDASEISPHLFADANLGGCV